MVMYADWRPVETATSPNCCVSAGPPSWADTGPTENGFRVVDVWESQEAFEAFGRDKLFAAFETAGVNPPPPHVFQVHNFVKD